MLIDFKEIPIANSGIGDQDTFEKFARDFLVELGYTILSEPTRGADGGLDIKLKETRKGVGGITDVYWLVSCKHYAQSGKSITPEIEHNITDRVRSSGCTGFIGFYSTVASSSLQKMLEGFSSMIEYQLFDNEKIEQRIIGYPNFQNIFLRYFPKSFINWRNINFYTEPVNLFNYYFEKEYPLYKGLFESIFHSTEYMIKPLREHNSLQGLLAHQLTKISVYDKMADYWWAAFYGRTYNGAEWLKLGVVFEDIVPQAIYVEEGIRINPKIISWGCSKEAVFALYPNHLVVNEAGKTNMENIFLDLKKMLG